MQMCHPVNVKRREMQKINCKDVKPNTENAAIRPKTLLSLAANLEHVVRKFTTSSNHLRNATFIMTSIVNEIIFSCKNISESVENVKKR